MVTAIACDELCCDLDWLGAVNLEVRSWAKEVVRAQPVRLDVTAVLVTHALETVFAVVTTVRAFTSSLAIDRAGMHCVGRCHFVCLPNVDLRAANSAFAGACIWIGVAWLPSFHVSFIIDEFQVMGALSIAVSQAHLCSSVAILALAAICIHLQKVQGTLQAAVQGGVINGVRAHVLEIAQGGKITGPMSAMSAGAHHLALSCTQPRSGNGTPASIA